MGLRRDARKHETLAAQRQASRTEEWWEHRPNARVMTIDGPGRVLAVHDGPFPGAEEYEVALDGGLGGGRYSPGQITAATPTTASAVEAAGHHLASEDYPELGTLLHDRPDPATLRYTAALGDDALYPAASEADDGEGLVMHDAGQYHAAPAGDFSLASRQAARAFDHYHPNQVYLRFGDWPDDERSNNNVTGVKEDGVSVYDLDDKGEPMDPDADFGRRHEHDEHCEDDCDLDSWNEDYSNDTREEMRGRVQRAEKNRWNGRDYDGETGHLVKGDMVSVGHDGEPLLNNVRRVGDWIDHRHLFIPGAPKHRLARDPDDEDYEEPEEQPTHRMASHHAAGDESLPRDWYHGTTDPDRSLLHFRTEPSSAGPTDPYEIPYGDVDHGDYEDGSAFQGGDHWNTRLGAHFSADPEVAKGFAGPEGRLFHVTVHARNPKVYRSEHDMDHEVYLDEIGRGNYLTHHLPGTDELWEEDLEHPVESHRGDDRREPYGLHEGLGPRGSEPRASNWLRYHPDREAIADRFKAKLMEQGHDAIVYGNEYEKGTGDNRAIIAFHPHQIEVRHVRRPDGREPSEHEAAQFAARYPGPGQQQLFARRAGARRPSALPTLTASGTYSVHVPNELPCKTCGDIHDGSDGRDWGYIHHRDGDHEELLPAEADELREEHEAAKRDEDETLRHASPSERMLYRMDKHGPYKETYAYYGDGGLYCHRCAAKDDFRDGEGGEPLRGTSWSDLRQGGSPHGEVCSDCHDELTEERPHTLRECEYGEDCPSTDEAHDANLENQQHRDFVGQHPERFIGEDLSHLHPDHERPVSPRGHGEAPLHLPEGTGIEHHWGSEEDFDNVRASHQAWTDHLHEQRLRTHDAEQQINELFGSPEFRQHKEFLKGNDRGPTHLSALTAGLRVQAHETWRRNPDDPEDIRRHLVEHHGEDPSYIGWSAEEHHDRLHEPDEDDWGYEEPEHEHHDVSREYSPMPWEGRERAGGSTQEDWQRRFLAPGGGTDYQPVPRTIQSLNMLVTAAMDPEFRIHVTAAWKDVREKAVRIRRSGGVNITQATDSMIFANVQGDHHVYETGLQRYPGRRQSVAVYSCGCKWGAYHWGASDDLSRFAGRMCSHALALQYEAQSRGMFGRDIAVDDAKPRWVPSKVVVKYDIDADRNIQAQSALLQVPEQAPLMVALALAEADDPALGAVLAAVNDLFGDSTGYTEPSLMNPQGATTPWNTEENPTSAGVLSGGDPRNWGSISAPTLFPRISSAMRTEAFWQALAPIIRAVAPSVIRAVTPAVKKLAPAAIDYGAHKLIDKVTQPKEQPAEGAEATLHEEPQGALPETDGEEHTAVLASSAEARDAGLSPEEREQRWPELTASLGDVDLVGSSGIGSTEGDELDPEHLSIQTQGGVAAVVAEFQRSAAARALMDGGRADAVDGMNLAAAAEAYLAKTAASEFTLAEREALIHESPGVQAANTDRLDIEGTHYAEIERRTDDGDDVLWLM